MCVIIVQVVKARIAGNCGHLKSAIWSKFEILPDICLRNHRQCQWKFLNMTDVQKSETSTHFQGVAYPSSPDLSSYLLALPNKFVLQSNTVFLHITLFNRNLCDFAMNQKLCQWREK